MLFQSLCLSISHLSPMQNTCLFTDSNKASLFVIPKQRKTDSLRTIMTHLAAGPTGGHVAAQAARNSRSSRRPDRSCGGGCGSAVAAKQRRCCASRMAARRSFGRQAISGSYTCKMACCIRSSGRVTARMRPRMRPESPSRRVAAPQLGATRPSLKPRSLSGSLARWPA